MTTSTNEDVNETWRWKTIDTAPHTSRKKILLCNYVKGWVAVATWPLGENSLKEFTSVAGNVYMPTHWMDIPALPTRKGENEGQPE